MGKNTIFTGAGIAIVTPMNADGSVNYAKYRELIDWQIENGTDAIITCGTTGESSTLTHEEHTQDQNRDRTGERPCAGDRGYRFQRHRLRY